MTLVTGVHGLEFNGQLVRAATSLGIDTTQVRYGVLLYLDSVELHRPGVAQLVNETSKAWSSYS